MISFNRAYIPSGSAKYVEECLSSGKIAGDNRFTKRCHQWLQERYGFSRPFLTTSCTDALEMAAILLQIGDGDEVIMPSFNFVSTANAFVLRNAKIIFADSNSDRPNMDVAQVEALITSKTKAIVPVHYGGIATDMDPLIALAKKYGLHIIENAAHAIDAYYKDVPLGSIGTAGAFSFHETKNITCGEGGMITINDALLHEKAEIIREKGTNRAAFFRGEVDKYGWVMPGSSFLPSDILAAVLLAQFEHLEQVQNRRKEIWQRYAHGLGELEQQGKAALPGIPAYARHNAHIFYLVMDSEPQRGKYIYFMKQNGVQTAFHYGCLHRSTYFQKSYKGPSLPNAERFADRLVRLPLFFELKDEEVDRIIELSIKFFQ